MRQKQAQIFESAAFARWVHGEGHALPPHFVGITQDSRKVSPGCLYVAIRGERFDGHAFVAQALQQGAAAALVAQDWCAPAEATSWPLLRVQETRRALLDAARAWRLAQRALIIGITGSSGKTTTKEMAVALFSAGGKVSATQGNQNNDLGLPLSLLTLAPDAAFGVFELGTNHPGEIAPLAEVLQPQIGIISSIGSAHIEHFGSQEAIIEEKGALLQVLPRNGCAILCREVTGFERLCALSNAPVVTTSLRCKQSDYYGEVLDVVQGTLLITEAAGGLQSQLSSGLPGVHNASNLLLAFAAIRQAGIAAQDAAAALQGLRMPRMRWEVVRRGGVCFVNDAYNANPQSMIAVLRTFMTLPCHGRRQVVLGDMLELGKQSESLHREVGRCVAELNPERLLTVGEAASQFLAHEAVRAGYSPSRVLCVPDVLSAATQLHLTVQPGDSILLKASRGVGLERILENFCI